MKEISSEIKASPIDTSSAKYLLGVLKNIERNMSKAKRERESNVYIIQHYLMAQTSKGGRTSSYEMCEYLGIDGDEYTFERKEETNG